MTWLIEIENINLDLYLSFIIIVGYSINIVETERIIITKAKFMSDASVCVQQSQSWKKRNLKNGEDDFSDNI